MDGITLTGQVVSISEKREVETRYGKAHVANAVLEDDTGKIVLNLWRSQIDLVKVGDLIKIENGFVRTFRQQLELNVGRKGRITVISRG